MTYISAIEDMVGSIRISFPPELKDYVRDSLTRGFERITHPAAAKWLLGIDEPGVLSTEDNDYDDQDLERILFTNEFYNAEDRVQFLSSILSLNESKIEEIAKATTGQTQNRLYCILKKFRLTASNFGVILSAIRRKKYSPSLYKRLLNTYNLDKVSS